MSVVKSSAFETAFEVPDDAGAVTGFLVMLGGIFISTASGRIFKGRPDGSCEESDKDFEVPSVVRFENAATDLWEFEDETDSNPAN